MAVGAIATESMSPRPAQGREGALHLVLGACADPAATGERQPVAGVEAEPERGEEQQAGHTKRPGAYGL